MEVEIPKNEIKRLVQLQTSLTEKFVGREREIDAVLAALLAGEPAILVGPPGTAKTAMVEALSRMISARYFYYLLTRFTEPDELLGPLDIEALKRGEYRRVYTGRLPEAEIAFLDEVFKASSAIRNILLDIVLNKRWLNGTRYEPLGLLALYTASNEVSHDAEDAAFYDRLLIRAFHGYVEDSELPSLLERGLALEAGDGAQPVMTRGDVEHLQSFTLWRARNIASSVMDTYVALLMALKDEGIAMSDRRKVKGLKVAAAMSVIYGAPGVTHDDVADAVRLVAPSDPDDVRRVEELILRLGIGGSKETIEKLMTLKAEAEQLLKTVESNPENATLQDIKALAALKKRIVEEVQRIRSNGGSRRILPYVAKLASVVERIERLLEDLS